MGRLSAVINYGDQLELHPTQQLSRNTWYKVTLPAGCVKEALGTLLPETYTFKFQTQRLSGPSQPQ
ncbi:MAG: Ig-like domain-containing protein [Candidatus Fervidibacter sp.]|uniref:Ig-like domain-containing protein n=1 Tax=Candidatus Fervidibacter sp. TaxID=3100871 RepID=UPI00404B2B06